MSLATILGVFLVLVLPPSAGATAPAIAVLHSFQDQSSSQSQSSSQAQTGSAGEPSAAQPDQSSQAPSTKPGDTGSKTAAEKPSASAHSNAHSTSAQTKRHHAKPKRKKHPVTAHSAKKPAPKPASTTPEGGDPQAAAPDKVVVPNGGTGDPKVQLAPEVTKQQAKSQQKNVDQLLASTDANLKTLSGRQLNSDQQDMVRQIRMYMEQAKAAVAAADLQRAHNLALKASLLADEMVKH